MSADLPHVLHRSSVNAWDCDENGHLNVRYYIGKNYQGLIHLLATFGLNRHAIVALGGRIHLRNQHIRFHREARMAAPLIVRGQVLHVEDALVVAYTEIRNTQDDTLYTSFTTEIEILDVKKSVTLSFNLETHPEPFVVPDYAGIRSLGPGTKPTLNIDAALAVGYFETGRGTVLNEECDDGGRMEIYQYAGRIADAIPTFMAAMQSEEEFALRSSGELGGAVVEYRVDYYSALGAGERFVIISGLPSFTDKTLRLSHLIFNLETAELVLQCQGVGVALDLRTRRAVAFSADRRERMTARLLR